MKYNKYQLIFLQHILKHKILNRIKIKTMWVGNSMKKHSIVNKDIQTQKNCKRTMPEKCQEITWSIQIDRELEELLYVPVLDRWHIPRLGNNCWRYVPCWCNFCRWCFQRRYCLIVHKKSWIDENVKELMCLKSLSYHLEYQSSGSFSSQILSLRCPYLRSISCETHKDQARISLYTYISW